ncbi:MAG: GTP-binding protein [Verrucomicrobiota bacterium]
MVIDGVEVYRRDGIFAGSTTFDSVFLTAGIHDITIYSFNGPGQWTLELAFARNEGIYDCIIGASGPRGNCPGGAPPDGWGYLESPLCPTNSGLPASFTVVDDDTTPPNAHSVVISGPIHGANTIDTTEMMSGGWSLQGLVNDADSGVNVNGTSTTLPDASPYVVLIDPSGTPRLTNALGGAFSDGGATSDATVTNLPFAGIAAPPVGTWTAVVYVTDNDFDRNGDALTTTASFTFDVTGAVVVTFADIAVDKAVDNPAPTEGDNFVYTLTASNAGPNAATGLTVNDVLPSNLVFVSSSSGDYDSTTGVWTVDTLALDATTSITIQVTAGPGSGRMWITNVAAVATLDNMDTNAVNDTAEAEDEAKITAWFDELMPNQGQDIFRMKGILNIAGEDSRFVFQGVHMMFDGCQDRPWRPDEPRKNELVFIGRNLEQMNLEESFRDCLVRQ